MKQKINEVIRKVYWCYLGKNLGCRTGAILGFIQNNNGREFFEQYSEPNDSIINFIRKIDENNLF